MTSHDSFFQKQQPAAVLKHALLAEYTRVFATMVGSRQPWLPIWVVDGYAGAGAYDADDNEGPSADGSPLVVLKMAKNLKNRDVRCIFIESSGPIVNALRRNVAPYVHEGMVAQVLEGNVEDKIGEARDLIGSNPVVTFLDPFGVAMRRSSMTNLLLAPRKNGGPSEVLLNINVQAVGRLGGLLTRRDGKAVPRDRQDASVARADAFLGGDWWHEEFYEARQNHAGSAARAARSVIRSYRDQVERNTKCRSLSIEIRRRPHHEPLFLLTLFFSHPYAGYKFADAASRATKKWRTVYKEQDFEKSYDDRDEEPLFAMEELRQGLEEDIRQAEERLSAEWVSIVKENIRRVVATQPDLPVAANIEAVLGDVIGLAGEAHIRKAWDQLHDEKVVRSRDKGKNIYSATIRAFRR